ncbi:MAG: MMPL family transporter, partial [Bacilli bacterium]|nr:MMPL family transporter [Bacilli bacterium]
NISIAGIDQFYKNKSALFQIMFDEDDYHQKTYNAIERVRDKVGNSLLPGQTFAMGGSAVSAYYVRVLTTSEVFKITLYVLPIILLILLIFTSSWVEPILFLIVVGVSVLVNMGTSAFLPSVSFLTNSTASLLQLAISMDYAIFLLHQYTKERENGLEKTAAIKAAMSKSFLSIGSSMLTTVAGFAALMFMRYSFGLDLGIVMVKGIVISLVATFTLMPALILLFDKLIIKTKHRPLFPKLGGLSKYIVKTRYVLPALMLLIAVPAFMAQNNNTFLYGESAMSVSEGSEPAQELDRIERKFSKNNMLVILAPNDEETNDFNEQVKMIKSLENELQTYEAKIQAYATIDQMINFVDLIKSVAGSQILPPWLEDLLESIPAIDKDFIDEYIPEEFIAQLEGENYSRIIISLNTDSESPEAFAALNIIYTIIHRFEDSFSKPLYLVGMTGAVMEIKEVVEKDFIFINLLSIALVFIILLASFRSLSVPVLLVLCIELSIWINMAIPWIQGSSLIFIGYMIVSSIQLGATIDYGILFTQNYLKGRETLNKAEAIKYSLDNSGHSILTSSLILTAAGYSLKFFSSVQGVSALGELIGRGAALSGLLVLTLLPQLLYLFDKLIQKSTLKLEFKEDKTDLIENEDPTLLS